MDDWAALRTWRPVVMGRRGAVAANHPLATEAGAAILRRGGNAADAYVAAARTLAVGEAHMDEARGGDAADADVAAASTLAVVEPHMSGLGGEGFALVYSAASGEAVVVNATGPAPRRATPQHHRRGSP